MGRSKGSVQRNFFFHGELDDYEVRKGDEKGLRRQTIISQDATYVLKKYVR